MGCTHAAAASQNLALRVSPCHAPGTDEFDSLSDPRVPALRCARFDGSAGLTGEVFLDELGDVRRVEAQGFQIAPVAYQVELVFASDAHD